MRKYFLFIFFLLTGFIFGVYLYMHRDRSRVFDGTETVYIKMIDNVPQLIRNGKPFYIKGASGSSYLKELSEAGGNTLRVYDTINLKAILDEAWKYNIAVIVDIPLPVYSTNDSYFTNPKNTQPLKRRIKNLISRHKNHPALLIWNLGNELNYPLSLTENAFIKSFNDIIDLIHSEDPDHLISTSVSGTSRNQTLGLLLNSPKLDIIGFNAFGSLPGLQPAIDQLSYITKTKPFYITEWGIHGPWEAPWNLWWAPIETISAEKGETYEKIYQSIIKNNTECLGSLVFYWGYKQEGTTTWFNIFDEEGRKSEAYYDLKSVWTGEIVINTVPKIDLLKLNDSITQNLIVLPNSSMTAEITTREPLDSTCIFKWGLYKEAWGYQNWVEESDVKMVSQFSDLNFSNKVKLKVPKDDGPYRLYVTIIDNYGNFATTNRPFYVLARE